MDFQCQSYARYWVLWSLTCVALSQVLEGEALLGTGNVFGQHRTYDSVLSV